MIAAEKIKQRKRDNSLRDLWRTPDWLFSAIQRYLGVTFDVDVACNKDNAKLPIFIGVERDALKSEWGAARYNCLPQSTLLQNLPLD